MFNRLRKVVSGAVEGFEDACNVHMIQPMIQGSNHLPHKHEYARPAFLHTSNEALSVAKDKKVRLILSTSGAHNALEHNAAYAECINAGKSTHNEDMAQVYRGTLRCEKSQGREDLHYSYYAIFDGHAGFGAALDASKQLHHILHQKLVDAQDYILAAINIENTKYIHEQYKKSVSVRDLIIGCMETAFCEMDEVIKESRYNYYNPGGCTALVALIISGDLYVANAGDCRAGIVNGDDFIQMSNDFSPYYDKTRIYETAASNTALLGDFYTVREFLDKPSKEDLGKNVLYKDPHMSGWSLKTLTSEDLHLPLVMGIGRRSRIMGTIGVARGFGDFDLTANLCKLPIKPLLSCVPEVKVQSLAELRDDAVFVMGSDGMWDAVDVQDVVDVCKQQRENHNAHVYTALQLVGNARGKRDNASGMWLLKNQSTASMDDISVFVVPVGAKNMTVEDKSSEINGSASDESMSDATHPLSVSSSSNDLIDIDGQEVTPLSL